MGDNSHPYRLNQMTASYATRNEDLIPEIAQLLEFTRSGNSEKRAIVLCNINHKLMGRGDEPDIFWQDFREFVETFHQA